MTFHRATTAHGLFETALDLPPERRAAFLDEACHGDAALRHEVESLLAFLDDARTSDLFPPLIGNLNAPLTLGERIGPYRVIRELGAGGMGVVFLAEREDVGKQVALKLLREGGMASAERVRRFLLERRVLARLEHPNIARLLDAGTTESRTPYLVMEYVEGTPIDRYCDEQRLAIADRLELFRTVCQAVHHAHQSLVVHRDLKPSNILVTTDGQVKLLDFGIAKLLADHASRPLAEVRTGLLMLTPEYASPEQVRGESVTTASDVYSLGVVLYQLLTGSRPYQLAARTAAEAERVICETIPPRPSDTASIERHRRSLRGDLDTIVLKALAKEPGRRYLSASQLSDDLRRHLVRLPVLARRDTAAYLMGKFLRRHWIGAGAAALILLSLIAGIAATGWQAQRAEAQRIVAEERFRDVRSLATTVLFEIHDAVAELPGATRARALLMNRGLEYLNRLSRQSHGDPGLQGEIAQAYIRLGMAQGNPTGANLGDLRAARVSLTKALMLASELVDDDSTNRGARRSLALAHEKLGDVKAWTGDVSGAVADAREALRNWEYLLRTEPENANARLAVAISTTKLGDLLGHPAFPNLGDRTGAELQYRRTLALLEMPSIDSVAERRRRRHIALSHERLGMMYKLEGRYDEALDALGRSLALREQLSREDVTTTDATRDVAVSRENLCQVHMARGNVAAAMDDCRKAVELYRGLHAADPGNAQGLTDLAVAESETADVLEARGQWTAALAALDRSTRLLQENLRSNPGNLPAERQLARNPLRASMLHARLAGALRGADRARHAGEARSLFERGSQGLTASLSNSSTSEDETDRTLRTEAEAMISKLTAGK
jgi:non-specific serine/threonine protein kinase/serine/threonine-protein kinase